MGAASPAKRAPRKAAAKKASPRKAAAAATGDERLERIAAFEDFRDRALDVGLRSRIIEPYVLGPEQGFDPPIVATWPTRLADLDAIDVASRRDSARDLMRVLFSAEDYQRLARALDAYAEKHGDSPEHLLYGMGLAITAHFNGNGSNEVGGTRAS